jgi:filamentous hemagglutinin family protein
MPALAQLELIPDTTPDRSLGTQIIPDGANRAVITGGTRSQNGSNLFHSFQEFNIRENRSVYFQNPAGVQNILTRVTGRDPSDILGTLGVLGAANLFLLNPNGIFFGPDARLQIGGAFVASTANSFRFPDGGEFSATNPQPPPLLTINITPGLQMGAISANSTIANRGNLSVGQDLVLEGDRLDLQGQLSAGQDVILKAQHTIQASDSTISPLIVKAGKNLLMQGDRGIDIVALSHPQSQFFSGGNLILRSANTVNGDARFRSGGVFRIEQLNGQPGNLSSPQDPVIFAVGDVVLGDYIGDSLHIWAGGSVTLGDVEITGVDPANSLFETVTLSDGSTLEIDGALVPTLDVRAGIDWSQSGGLPGNIDSDGLGATFAPTATSADITIGNITNFIGTVFITNQYVPNQSLSSPSSIRTGTIDVSNIDANGNTFDADAGTVVIDSRSGFSLNNNNIFANTSVNDRFAGNVRLLASGGIFLNGVGISNNVTSGVASDGGNITIRADSLSLANASFLRSDTLGVGNAGNITIQVRDTVALTGQDANGIGSSINSRVGDVDDFAVGNSGAISITARSVVLRDGAFLDTSILNGIGENGNPAIAGAVQITATDTVSLDQSRIFSNVGAGSFGLGGNITINSGSVSLTNGANLLSFLRAEDQTLPGAIGEAGNITINAQGLVSFDGIGSDGTVTSAESNVGLGAVGNAGKITINAGALSLTNGAQFSSSTFGVGDAADITIQVRDAVSLKQGQIFSNVEAGAFGNGGAIAIHAGSLPLQNAAFLASDTLGVGNAGNITIQVRDTVSLTGRDEDGFSSGFFSRVGDFDNFAEGNGGMVSITARSVILRDGAFFDTSVLNGRGANGGLANAGNIQINATETVSLDQSRIFSNVDTASFGIGGDITINSGGTVSLTNGANLLSFLQAETETEAGAIGEAGNITINAQGFVSLDGASPEGAVTSAESNVGFGAVGNAGKITINAEALSVTNGAQLSSSTAGLGNAADITIRARGLVQVNGATESGFVSLIDSQVGEGGRGTAGRIDITAESLALTKGGQILTLTRGVGDAGPITLTLRDRLTLDGTAPDGSPSAIVSDVEFTGAGTSGGITINTGSLLIRNGAELTASTKGFGNAGSIFITAREQVNITGDGSATPNDIPEGLVPNSINSSADRASIGNGGSIRIDTPRLFVNQGARILVSNLEEGQAGSITINARSATLDQGYIQATTSSGNGGDISLNLRDILLLRRGSLISATAGTEAAGGNGGNVTIRSSFIIGVLRENSDITANAFTGRGGNINITTNAIFGLRAQPQLTPLSDITASSEFGLSGTIAITTLNVDPNRGLVALPTNLTDPSRQISQGCSPKNANSARIGRFVVTGRGGIPASPDAVMTSDRPLVDLVSLMPSNLEQATLPADVTSLSEVQETTDPPRKSAEIVEAQTWITGEDGEVYLMANAEALSIQPGMIGIPTCVSQ